MTHYRLILLGTGTDVGKTYVGCEIARVWRERVGPVLGLKPIESGFAEPSEGDAAALRQAASFSPLPLYRFAPPVSPHLAARRADVVIDPKSVVDWIAREEEAFLGVDLQGAPSPTLTIIETAGGVFSPISETATNFDLLKEFSALSKRAGEARTLLIAPDALGVLHDVQATLRAMAPERVDLVVLSESRPQDASTGSNAEELENLVFKQLGAGAPRHAQVLRLGRAGSGEAVVDWILAQ
jgi:dethiobiotin synthetase